MKYRKRSVFAQHLIEIRTIKKWSQARLAEELDVSHMTVNAWETDRRQPRMEMLARFPAVLGVSIDWLLGVDRTR